MPSRSHDFITGGGNRFAVSLGAGIGARVGSRAAIAARGQELPRGQARRGAAREVILVVSVDTEEDNWEPCRNGVTVENIAELPHLHLFLRRLGVRATYFTTYQAVVQPSAAATLRAICQEGGAEVGAHLHPWNTPPFAEQLAPANTMLSNLPAALQFAKLEQLTTALTGALGAAPTAFRAGRYGLGPTTVHALIQCGYEVDSSVTPYVNWEETDGGPNFVGAPLDAYRLAPGHDVRTTDPEGALLEVPVSAGYTRTPFGFWDPMRRMLELRALRRLPLAAIASNTGLIRRVLLNPELASVRDMLTLSRRLIELGIRHLNLTWHSPSLRPGLSPFVVTKADRDRLYRAIESYVEGLDALVSIRFATMSEAGAMLSPGTA